MNAVVSPLPTRRRDDEPAAGQTQATGPAWVTSPRRVVPSLPPLPVVLQIAPQSVETWTDVVRFDMRDQDACGVIEYHAPGVAVVGRAKLRVITDDSLQKPLRHWDIEHGWRDWGQS